MRKLTLVLAVLAFALVSKTTGAQSSVVLNPQSSGTITFSDNVINIALTGVVKGITTSNMGGLSTATTYSMGPGTVTLTPTGGGSFTASGNFAFELNGGTLLKGTLTLGSAFETGTSPGNLIFTYNGVLTVTSGSVCDPTCPVYDVTLTLQLLPGGGLKLTDGFIQEVTPEPSSMLLFGTGLLACGIFLRRRLT
jgi:hypothetical protein